MYQAALKYYNTRPGVNFPEIKVLMLAPTGKAAYVIKGNTVHSAQGIPACQSLKNYKRLDSGRLNTLRCQLGGVKLIFIDEISMVGNTVFNVQINNRLKDIKGSSLPFGGVSIIANGDLFQLEPVMDGYIFKDMNNLEYGILAPNIWQERFKMFELHEIMRQRESKQFAEMLNRLREGNHIKEDIMKFKERILQPSSTDYPKDAPHLFIQNAQVNEFNDRAHRAISGAKYSIKAHNSVIGANSQQLRDKILQQIPSDPRKTKQLHGTLNLAVGERTEISLNTRTDDGLTNGAANVIKLIQVHRTDRPSGIIWVLSKGLKFIPTPTVKENAVRKELLLDFKQFARRMRLRYIFHNRNKEQHPFHVKSDWEPPVQPSVALETYLEEVKGQLAEIALFKPRNNLPSEERKAIKDLRSNSDIVIKKVDKGTTTVIMNTKDKIQEGQVLLDDKNNYTPLTASMAKETARKTRVIINDLHQGNHIDTMTKKWLLQTPDPPRIPVFYTLTKIHKPTLPGRPIISGCDGPTERISSFLDHILQPIAQAQKSYLKDTTQFINFIEKRTVPKNAILVSMDVNSLYTNIPQEEGIYTVCEAYESFYKNDTPIPTHSLAGLLRLILQENSFQFKEKTICRLMALRWGPKLRSLSPTSLCLQ